MSQPAILPELRAAPTPPLTGKAAVYARNRARLPKGSAKRVTGTRYR